MSLVRSLVPGHSLFPRDALFLTRLHTIFPRSTWTLLWKINISNGIVLGKRSVPAVHSVYLCFPVLTTPDTSMTHPFLALDSVMLLHTAAVRDFP